MSDAQVFLLPDVGEGLTEAEIVTWHVQVGDEVSINDTLLEVETAKSVVELPSPFAGVVLELHAKGGDLLPVGAPLITVGPPMSDDQQTRVPAPEPVDEPPVPDVQPAPTTSSGAPEAAAVDPTVGHVPSPDSESQAPLILVGTGPKEAVARRVHVRRLDGPLVERSVGPAISSDEVRPNEPTADTRVPVKGVRRATAEAMVRSAFSAPHAAMWATVDVTATMELIQRIKGNREWAGVRVTHLVVIARIVALAAHRYPEINASWDEPNQEIVLHRALNLGVAAATPRGLMVPNIKDAGSMSLRELAVAFEEVIARARAGKLAPSDMSGGTLTVTNVGTFGVEGATPILNPPEAAILALGAIQQRPWVMDGVVLARDVMTLSISIDHRLVDGELGASFLRHIASLLHDPAQALL